MGHKKTGKILKEFGIPDHFTCPLRNLHAGQEPSYLIYMQNTSHKKNRLYESQDGIKTAERNINNFRYEDDNTLMAESEGLKCLLMKVKEEHEKAGLKLSIQKTNIVALAPSFQGKEMRGKWKQ